MPLFFPNEQCQMLKGYWTSLFVSGCQYSWWIDFAA